MADGLPALSTDLVRVELANAGFTECLNMALVGRLENFDYLRRVRYAWDAAPAPTDTDRAGYCIV